jgi:hypothetical protein
LGAREGESERSGDGRTSGAVSGEEMARRQRGRGGGQGERGGPGVGCHATRRGAMGPGPDQWTAPAAARARRSRVTCAARALPAETKRGERRLTGGPAQCRAAVPLRGGSDLPAA